MTRGKDSAIAWTLVFGTVYVNAMQQHYLTYLHLGLFLDECLVEYADCRSS
jgi:hypothetical protein